MSFKDDGILLRNEQVAVQSLAGPVARFNGNNDCNDITPSVTMLQLRTCCPAERASLALLKWPI